MPQKHKTTKLRFLCFRVLVAKKITMTNNDPVLIAPCGMDCRICSSFLTFDHNIPKVRHKISHCTGCRPRGKQCAWLIKRCDKLLEKKLEYCFECEDFPCPNLSRLDKNYRKNYQMSMIENLTQVRDQGFERFFENQKAKYGCPTCESLTSVHSKKCFRCGEVHSWKD